ncbi:hypothetical protein DLJ53_25340 [Acuticoccus sediminis]|uniref:Cysteine rich repeat-containing protein n=1 Tax=Acuticoccus sediminis TaxID=2184697 RepID=A0A8B2NKD8_9HYPH|nr:cysteine rich repeat-containing protein [Acuticoccus sediminis]RAH98957.1 hypothetical protein DLJ53_25340 [Acuticoccus sediminis]
MSLTRRAGVSALAAAALLTAGGIAAAQTAKPQLSRDQQVAILKACKDDYKRYCTGVEPGDGRIARCMAEHRESLSDQCRTTVRNVMLK